MLGLALVASTGAWAGFETPVTPQDGNVVPGTGDFNWSAVTRLFVGWDSNVELYADVDAPGNPALDGVFGGATLDVAFTKMLGPNLTLGGDLRADVLGYIDTMPAASIPTYGTQSDYDIVAAQPTVYLKYMTTLANGTDVTLNGTYSFRAEKSKNEEGLASRSHQLSASATFDVPGPWAFAVSAAHTFDDFNDIYPGEPVSDRDGQFTEIAAEATYTFAHLHLRRCTAASPTSATTPRGSTGPIPASPFPAAPTSISTAPSMRKSRVLCRPRLCRRLLLAGP